MSNNNDLKAIKRGLTVDLLDQRIKKIKNIVKAKNMIKKFEQARNEATNENFKNLWQKKIDQQKI